MSMAEWYGKDIKTSAKECAGYFRSKQQHLWINKCSTLLAKESGQNCMLTESKPNKCRV